MSCHAMMTSDKSFNGLIVHSQFHKSVNGGRFQDSAVYNVSQAAEIHQMHKQLDGNRAECVSRPQCYYRQPAGALTLNFQNVINVYAP